MAYIGKTPIVGNFQKCDALTASATADYTLQVGSSNVVPESANHMLVSLNGVIQQPGASGGFTVSGSTLSFTSALTSSDTIDFVILLGNVLDIGTPSDDTVATAKIQDDAVTAAKINTDLISGTTALATAPADTDEFLVSDAGTLKRLDYSLIKASPAMTLLNTTTVSSGVSSVTINPPFSSTYREYRISFDYFDTDTDTHIELTFLESDDTEKTSAYSWTGNGSSAGTVLQTGNDSDSCINLSGGTASTYKMAQADGSFNGRLTIYNPQQTANTCGTGELYWLYSTQAHGNNIHFSCGNSTGDTTSYTQFKIAVGSGNIDNATIRTWGIT